MGIKQETAKSIMTKLEKRKRTQQLRAVNIENMLDMQYSVVPGPPVRPGHPVSSAGLFP